MKADDPRTRRGPDADTEGLGRSRQASPVDWGPPPDRPWFGGVGWSPPENASAKRADDVLREAVADALMDALIDTRSMEIVVEQGIVILRGLVRDRYSRKLAEELALEERGTARVINELEVVDSERWAELRGGRASTRSS